MSLIKSISGFRGTIGGVEKDNLTPIDLVKFTSAFAQFLKESLGKDNLTVVVGRDARVSGFMVKNLVIGTLMGMGVDVIDTDLSTTPTVEMAVIDKKADGGIILTASHNPMQWNALKFLSHLGEFITNAEGKRVLELADKCDFSFATVEKLGHCTTDTTTIDKHIEKILALPLVDKDAIAKADFKVCFDAVNSTGGLALPKLFEALGVKRVVALNDDVSGVFAHNPEPLPENISQICDKVVDQQCNVGFIVDPDVDRLAIVCETGKPFVEEYTLVAVADYILSNTPGKTVSNLSSSRALRVVTEKYNQEYNAAAVGEVNVVAKMKETNAVIGGEGNGGVIYPELHYGRDALVGIALFLTLLAKKNTTPSALRDSLPYYVISKNKMELTPDIDVDKIFEVIAKKYSSYDVVTIDGVKINFDDEWVHLRKSNTESIIRIYSESDDITKANHLANTIIEDITAIIRHTLV
jgi:phosphoglucosamine mutase